jgi:hypothetical protein
VTTCPIDGAEMAPGATICGGCVNRTRQALRAVPSHLRDLELTSAGLRSSWREPGPRGGTGEPRLAMNIRAAEARTVLIDTLAGWVHVWITQTPPSPERAPAVALLITTPEGHAALLASIPNLGARTWAGDAAREILDACREAEYATDTPAVRILVCTCTCGVEVMSDPDAKVAACRECGAVWDVAVSRALAVEASGDLAAPAAVIERALGPTVVTAAMIRGWKHRGTLAVAYMNTAGQPCYLLAAVSKLAREGAPHRIPRATPSPESEDHVDAATCANG